MVEGEELVGDVRGVVEGEGEELVGDVRGVVDGEGAGEGGAGGVCGCDGMREGSEKAARTAWTAPSMPA